VHPNSYHDEIFHVTGVQRTNTEIKVNLFDNANYYDKKQAGTTKDIKQMKIMPHCKEF